MGENRKLWIGGIDHKVTEYQLLQLVKSCGTVKSFNFVYHASGDLKGLPRGYCFVQYQHLCEATRAIAKLDGLLIGASRLKVVWANKEKTLVNNDSSSTSTTRQSQPISSRQVIMSRDRNEKIKELERKLKSFQESDKAHSRSLKTRAKPYSK